MKTKNLIKFWSFKSLTNEDNKDDWINATKFIINTLKTFNNLEYIELWRQVILFL